MSLTTVQSNDPFSTLLSKLWETVAVDAELSSLVKIGNRIRYDTDRRLPEKQPGRQDADAPELRILPIADVPNICATSNAGFYNHRLQFEISTIDERLTIERGLYPVMWALYRFLARAQDTLGLCFVKSARPVDLSYQSNLSGTKGWTAIMTAEFLIVVNRQQFIAGIV